MFGFFKGKKKEASVQRPPGALGPPQAPESTDANETPAAQSGGGFFDLPTGGGGKQTPVRGGGGLDLAGLSMGSSAAGGELLWNHHKMSRAVVQNSPLKRDQLKTLGAMKGGAREKINPEPSAETNNRPRERGDPCASEREGEVLEG